jgi:predicted DNA-binding antitoxin AbrB/MazE fold protein
MNQVITATFEDGYLRPDNPLNLSPHQRVRLIIEPLEDASHASDEAWEELDRVCEENSIDSGGAILTRDQRHERR